MVTTVETIMADDEPLLKGKLAPIAQVLPKIWMIYYSLYGTTNRSTGDIFFLVCCDLRYISYRLLCPW